jgi:hypothetical protein
MWIKPGFVMEEAPTNEPMKPGDWGFHGDVIIKCVDTLPTNFDELENEPNNCLAYGELSGHAHQLQEGEFEIKVDKDNPTMRHLRIVKPTALRHQEHKTVMLQPGNYQIGIQQEYDPFTKKLRQVID